MKKIVPMVSTIVLSTAFIGSVAGAQAPQNCDVLVINGTGPGSTNQVVCDVTVDVNVVCDNNVYVLDTNSQTAVSGAASSQGNVTSGTAISGNATNSNGQTVAIGTSCSTSTTTGEQPEPGRGGGGAFVPPETVDTLPNTNNGSLAPTAIAGVAGIATTIAMSHLAISAYRRFGSN